METNSILIQDNITSRKELQDIQQRTTSYYGSSNQVETIFIEHHRKVQSLDRSQESQVLQETLEIK